VIYISFYMEDEMNKGTFRYIDKDKILPWLESEINFHMDDADGEYAYQKFLLLRQLVDIKHFIENGMFDWQQGSE
jgi:hypothetical protein